MSDDFYDMDLTADGPKSSLAGDVHRTQSRMKRQGIPESSRSETGNRPKSGFAQKATDLKNFNSTSNDDSDRSKSVIAGQVKNFKSEKFETTDEFNFDDPDGKLATSSVKPTASRSKSRSAEESSRSKTAKTVRSNSAISIMTPARESSVTSNVIKNGTKTPDPKRSVLNSRPKSSKLRARGLSFVDDTLLKRDVSASAESIKEVPDRPQTGKPLDRLLSRSKSAARNGLRRAPKVEDDNDELDRQLDFEIQSFSSKNNASYETVSVIGADSNIVNTLDLSRLKTDVWTNDAMPPLAPRSVKFKGVGLRGASGSSTREEVTRFEPEVQRSGTFTAKSVRQSSLVQIKTSIVANPKIINKPTKNQPIKKPSLISGGLPIKTARENVQKQANGQRALKGDALKVGVDRKMRIANPVAKPSTNWRAGQTKRIEVTRRTEVKQRGMVTKLSRPIVRKPPPPEINVQSTGRTLIGKGKDGIATSKLVTKVDRMAERRKQKIRPLVGRRGKALIFGETMSERSYNGTPVSQMSDASAITKSAEIYEYNEVPLEKDLPQANKVNDNSSSANYEKPSQTDSDAIKESISPSNKSEGQNKKSCTRDETVTANEDIADQLKKAENDGGESEKVTSPIRDSSAVPMKREPTSASLIPKREESNLSVVIEDDTEPTAAERLSPVLETEGGALIEDTNNNKSPVASLDVINDTNKRDVTETIDTNVSKKLFDVKTEVEPRSSSSLEDITSTPGSVLKATPDTKAAAMLTKRENSTITPTPRQKSNVQRQATPAKWPPRSILDDDDLLIPEELDGDYRKQDSPFSVAGIGNAWEKESLNKLWQATKVRDFDDV